jgi:glycosyltransferase involved in cell wall biosynthesis
LNARISVALCTYNGEKYLAQQIDSILKQSIVPFEIVVVDDCSTDATIEILESYSKSTNLRFFINDDRLGFVKNFEKAIGLCSGDYVLLSDQDDVWVDDKVECLVREIGDSALVYSNALLVTSDLKPINKYVIDHRKVFPVSGSNCLAFVFNNCASGNTMMFKSELVSIALPFPDNIPFHDVYLAFVASACGGIKYLDRDLVLYRQHNSSVTDRAGIKGKVRKNKLEAKILANKKRLIFLKAFFGVKCFIGGDKEIVESLINYFEGYEHYFFKLTLFLLLLKNKRKLFEIDKNITFVKIVKLSLGLKAYRFFPFL